MSRIALSVANARLQTVKRPARLKPRRARAARASVRAHCRSAYRLHPSSPRITSARRRIHHPLWPSLRTAAPVHPIISVPTQDGDPFRRLEKFKKETRQKIRASESKRLELLYLKRKRLLAPVYVMERVAQVLGHPIPDSTVRASTDASNPAPVQPDRGIQQRPLSSTFGKKSKSRLEKQKHDGLKALKEHLQEEDVGAYEDQLVFLYPVFAELGELEEYFKRVTDRIGQLDADQKMEFALRTLIGIVMMDVEFRYGDDNYPSILLDDEAVKAVVVEIAMALDDQASGFIRAVHQTKMRAIYSAGVFEAAWRNSQFPHEDGSENAVQILDRASFSLSRWHRINPEKQDLYQNLLRYSRLRARDLGEWNQQALGWCQAFYPLAQLAEEGRFGKRFKRMLVSFYGTIDPGEFGPDDYERRYRIFRRDFKRSRIGLYGLAASAGREADFLKAVEGIVFDLQNELTPLMRVFLWRYVLNFYYSGSDKLLDLARINLKFRDQIGPGISGPEALEQFTEHNPNSLEPVLRSLELFVFDPDVLKAADEEAWRKAEALIGELARKRKDPLLNWEETVRFGLVLKRKDEVRKKGKNRDALN